MSDARRRRSRGVPARPRKPHLALSARVRLYWATMYPLPRIVISAALLLVAAYGVVALVVMLPEHDGAIVALYGVPVLVAAITIALFAHGEPNDQTAVHVPPAAPAQMSHADRRMSDAEFDVLEDEVDRYASTDEHRPQTATQDPSQGAAARSGASKRKIAPRSDDDGFSELVREAIDDLPPQFIHALDHVAVVVSDQGSVQRINGRRRPLYGLYIGYASRGPFVIGAPSRSALPDRIVIFRDTLTHDYGQDPQRLRAEVTRTLRHELAHHLGADEKGVGALGL
jgi:predicted Zn-dependent protease with MMP-like domain